ncbi:uncharacterized protein LOC102803503 [Saccoglossus kowalevskii]
MELSNRLFEVMARGLQLEDPLLFVNAHKGIKGPDNTTTLRTLYYPPISQDIELKPNQIRCGEHSDYGSMTLLFQDDIGGLEIQCLDGSFIDATPIDGSIIVNIGDLMQRWTSDKLVSAVHKVGIPKSIKKRESSRQSIAFFNVPDNFSVVMCVDGSDKYPAIRPDDYLKHKFYETFKI